MELSQSFNFITILNDSLKLLGKNLKPISAITSISLTLLSIFILLLSYSIQFLPNDLMLKLCVVFVLEILILITIFAIFIFCRISTVLILSTSYTGNALPLQDLFPIFKSTYKLQAKTNLYVSSLTIPYSILIGILVNLVILKPNFTTISISILLGIPATILHFYFLVVWVLAYVVSVMEEECYGEKAVERAKELAEGQKVHGFLMNLFFNLVAIIVTGGYWMIDGDKGFMNLNLTMLALFTVNVSYLFQVLILATYTVFYFQCKKHRGEEIIGYVQYSKVPDVQLANDIP